MVAGLALEARGLLRRLPPASRLALRVRAVGPGASGLGRLEPPGGAAVLVTGLAGGCAPGLRPGDVVVGDPVTAAGPGLGSHGADADLRARAVRALDLAGLPYRIGPLLTVAEVAATPASKAEWWRVRGALAVDMESAHVLAWAARAGRPALAVRAIADGPDDEVPRELVRAVGADGRLRPVVAAAGFLGRPALVGAAWRLGRRSRRALGRLATFIQVFAEQPGQP